MININGLNNDNNNNEIKKVFRILSKVGRIIWPTHKGLENGKENIAIFGRLTPFLYLVRGYPYQSIFGESGEVIECLVSENIAVSEK